MKLFVLFHFQLSCSQFTWLIFLPASLLRHVHLHVHPPTPLPRSGSLYYMFVEEK